MLSTDSAQKVESSPLSTSSHDSQDPIETLYGTTGNSDYTTFRQASHSTPSRAKQHLSPQSRNQNPDSINIQQHLLNNISENLPYSPHQIRSYDLTPSHVNRMLKEQQRSGSQSPIMLSRWMSQP